MKTPLRSRAFTFLFCLGLLTVSACGSKSGGDSSETSAEEAEPAAEMAEQAAEAASSGLKTWTLASYGPPDNLNSVPESVTITMQMDVAANRVSGSAGCNNYFGGLSAEDSGYRILGVGSTRKMCADNMVMEMEQKYLGMVDKVTGYAFRDNKMIMDVEGGLQLVFTGS